MARSFSSDANLVPRVFRLFGRRGNAGKGVAPLTKKPEGSGYEIDLMPFVISVTQRSLPVARGVQPN